MFLYFSETDLTVDDFSSFPNGKTRQGTTLVFFSLSCFLLFSLVFLSRFPYTYSLSQYIGCVKVYRYTWKSNTSDSQSISQWEFDRTREREERNNKIKRKKEKERDLSIESVKDISWLHLKRGKPEVYCTIQCIERSRKYIDTLSTAHFSSSSLLIFPSSEFQFLRIWESEKQLFMRR